MKKHRKLIALLSIVIAASALFTGWSKTEVSTQEEVLVDYGEYFKEIEGTAVFIVLKSRNTTYIIENWQNEHRLPAQALR